MKQIIVFDFDGTITKFDTLFYFIVHVHGLPKLVIGLLVNIHVLVALKLGIMTNDKAKEKIFKYFFQGMKYNLFKGYGISFSHKIDKIVRPMAIKTLKNYIENGDCVCVISASILEWVKPWCENHGINNVLCTEIEVDEFNNLSGNFKSKNCYGQEKVNRLLSIFPNRRKYSLTAYGDSDGDKEIINFSDLGFYNAFK